MKKKHVIIVGAGASGLMAGIIAARNGAAVTILEQNEKPGKKINATGNGRCNYTNLTTPENAYRGEHPEFVQEALSQFSVSDTIEFFKELGIYPLDRKGYLYPRSGQAQSVTEVLCMEAANLGVKIKTNEKVVSVEKVVSSQKKTNGFRVLTEGWHYEGDALILANGSRASVISGSDGSGYELAKKLGHHIVPVWPALTALKCKGNFFKTWSGVRTEGKITLFSEGKPVVTEQGELQLTDYGVSGIPVFQISRYAVRNIKEGRDAEITIDFMPELSADEFRELLLKRKRTCPYKNDRELLIGLFPEKLIRIFAGQKDLVRAVKSLTLTVTDSLSFAQAQVCSGGVDTREIHSRTMESRKCRNLYITGELLDIDGTCGGYNLQWAWSSGAAAGVHAAADI